MRTYTNTYLADSAYTSLYIRNRLLSSTLSDGTNTTTLVSNTYDTTALTDAPGLRGWAAAEVSANANKISQYLGVAKSATELITTDDGYVVL